MQRNFTILPTNSVLRIALLCALMFVNLLGLASITGFVKVVFAAPMVKDLNLQVQRVAAGLSLPTSMAFVGPNDILVLEKNTGLVKRIKDGRVLPSPLLDVTVASTSERGMLGIDVVRITSLHHYVFLYYTKSSVDGGAPVANQLVRYIFINDPRFGSAQGTMTSPRVLLNMPATPGPNHNGGKVVIGPDRNVYTILGDLNRQTQAQNFESGPPADGTGGILRITQDGSTVGSGIIGTTNPLNKYFAYGIRNSFGIDFDPVTGRLWETENGPASNDELNLVEPGFNSGWRDLMGMAPAGFNFNNLVSFGGKGKYSNPEFEWTQVIAPTAIEFLSSTRLGLQYQNDMFVADFNKGRIYNFNLNSQRNGLLLGGVLADRIANTDTETQAVIFGEGFGRLTDLKMGLGDGYLYALSISDGSVYRILPKASVVSFSDAPRLQELEKDNEMPTLPPDKEELEIPFDFDSNNEEDNNENEEGKQEDASAACKKLEDRIDQINEQQSRGGLSEQQIHELLWRIEAIRNNLECK